MCVPGIYTPSSTLNWYLASASRTLTLCPYLHLVYLFATCMYPVPLLPVHCMCTLCLAPCVCTWTQYPHLGSTSWSLYLYPFSCTYCVHLVRVPLICSLYLAPSPPYDSVQGWARFECELAPAAVLSECRGTREAKVGDKYRWEDQGRKASCTGQVCT